MNNTEEYLRQIERYYNKQMDVNEFITICSTPDFLIDLNVPALPVVIKQSTIKKCIREPKGSISAHSLSRQMIESIPEQLNNPIFIVDEKQRNSYALISDYLDDNGYPMLMAISMRKTILGIEVNEITSFYGRNNLEFYLTQRHTPDEVFIKDIEKAKMLSRFLRLQLPTAWKVLDYSDICKKNVSHSTDDVKNKICKDLKENGFTPTPSLIQNIQTLNSLLKKDISIKTIHTLHQSLKHENIQKIIQEIGNECALQEKNQTKIQKGDFYAKTEI